MIQAYDHRAAGVIVTGGNWMRQGQTEESSLVKHQNPEFVAMPRFWVAGEGGNSSSRREEGSVPGLKDVTSPTNQRTMMPPSSPGQVL